MDQMEPEVGLSQESLCSVGNGTSTSDTSETCKTPEDSGAFIPETHNFSVFMLARVVTTDGSIVGVSSLLLLVRTRTAIRGEATH